LFLLVLAFYIYTLAPSVTWGDGARLQMEVMTGGSTYWLFGEVSQVHTDGLPFDRLGVAVWDHPLYVMLGQAVRLLPWGEPPFRINLMSALAGALTIAITARIALTLTGDPWAATCGALALTVSHTFWFHAVTAEVYTLHSLFMVGLIWLALRWPEHGHRREQMLFAFLAGLGMANHVMLVLTLGPALAYIWITSRHSQTRRAAPSAGSSVADRGSFARCLALVGMFVLGFAPWWLQFLRMARIVGVPLTLELATGYPWLPQSLFGQPSVDVVYSLGAYLGLLLYQFTPFGVALGVYGCRLFWCERNRAVWLLSALFLAHALFSANYHVPDRFAFHMPSYIVFALFIANGIAGALRRLDAAVRPGGRLALAGRGLALLIMLLPVVIYAQAPSIVRALGYNAADMGIPTIGTGARDGLAYYLDPNQRGDDSAARFGRLALAQVLPHGLVFTGWPSDQEAYVVLRYVQVVEKLRPDVQLDLLLFASSKPFSQRVLEQAHAQQSCRPLYLASLNPELYPLKQLQVDFAIVPEGYLYRLVPRRASAQPAACPDPAKTQAGVSLEQLIRRAIQ
jgi:hypothetical protein